MHMLRHNPSCLIGVDGGGTSCRIALLKGDERTELHVASANVHSDPDGAVATLRAGLHEAARLAGLEGDGLERACGVLGLAGVTGPRVAAAIAARLPLGRAKVVEDCVPAVVGALGDGDGAVAGLGTGSFFARQAGGAVDLRGGWGFVLGDEASGAWLGRGLLARVLHVEDGLVPATALTRATRDGYDGGPEGILAFVAGARPADYAALAPRVVAAARDGDAAGLFLMRAGAAHVQAALEALGWRPPDPLCLTGGLAPHYVPYVPAPTAAAIVPAKATALDGALRMAARLADGAAA